MKVSEKKEVQGFTKDSPKCANCIHYQSEVIVNSTIYGDYKQEKNIHCGFGGFKVGKSNWCKLHERKD